MLRKRCCKYNGFKKIGLWICIMSAAGMLAACGQAQELSTEKKAPQSVEREESETNESEEEELGEKELEEKESQKFEIFAEENLEKESEENSVNTDKKPTDKEDAVKKEADAVVRADAMREKFGENCIVDQTFEVGLSEYQGKVYFVPFMPSESGSGSSDFQMQLIQDGKILTEIMAYIPKNLAGTAFGSLDAVSFYDVNYDGNTDIVLIETYGNTSFAVIYYGYGDSTGEYEPYFVVQETLSEAVSSQAEQISISGVRSFLADGKKNGKFSSYQEAYLAVSTLYEVERASEGEYRYNLIYFDEDEIPELVVGNNGYYMSLYTYQDGTVYTLMDHWGYGAMGNAGYEYAPKKNNLRNYNTDYAGAMLYTTYEKVSEQHTMDMVAQIQTYNWDDVNENGILDEEEQGSVGRYSVSYIDGREVTAEECVAYDAGEYEYIEAAMTLEMLQERLK